MSRTVWLALFCLIGLAPAIAIKVAAPPAPLVVTPAQDHQSKVEREFAPNESAKADRQELPQELPNARAETEMVAPAAKPVPAETPSTNPGTVKKAADQHWRNANAKIIPAVPPPQRTKSKALEPIAARSPPNEKAGAWHCRQDAMGGLLRSLDLSPRCNL
jgi:hypothetical protein